MTHSLTGVKCRATSVAKNELGENDCDGDFFFEVNRQSIGGASYLGRQDLGGGHPHQRAVTDVEHEDVHLLRRW